MTGLNKGIRTGTGISAADTVQIRIFLRLQAILVILSRIAGTVEKTISKIFDTGGCATDEHQRKKQHRQCKKRKLLFGFDSFHEADTLLSSKSY